MSKAIVLAALAATLAAPATAQYDGGPQYGRGSQYGQGGAGPGARRGGPPRAILFSQPGFEGRRLVIDRPIGKLDRLGFDDKASSIMIKGDGAWRVCVDDHFGGRCEIIDHAIPDLTELRLNNQISSIGPVGPGRGGY